MNNLKKRSDEELVAQFMSGQNEAFDVLLQRHQERLYAYISYIVKNQDVADDIFQETFVKAIVKMRQGRYREDGKFYAWLTCIAHNLLIDFFRDERNLAYVYDDEENNIFRNCSDLSDTYRESELNNNQVLKDVRSLMDHLPENQREVVFMRFYQDLSFKEIAEITGVSINTALGRMRYGIMNMRRMAEENHISLALD